VGYGNPETDVLLSRGDRARNMKAVFLTAGAAGMYCGSCMRDNTLVAALRARGRDAMLVPLYTPIRTDETDVSEPRVFYGAINVYLQQKLSLFRHTPRRVDRLFDHPSILRNAARLASGAAADDLGAMTVSVLRGEHGAQRKELARLLEWLGEVRPTVVSLPNAFFVGIAGPIRQAIRCPVICTLTGEDVFLDALPEPHRSDVLSLIRAHASDVDGFVAVSDYYASYARERFALPTDRVHVVRLGIDTAAIPRREEPPDGPFTIGYLARICPEKGLHVLADAFIVLRTSGRSCRLRVAGWLGASSRRYLDEVRTRISRAGFGGDFEYVGEVNRTRKAAFLQSVHVLSVPTVYREAKGLYVLEAMAHGVPVAQPRHGSFPELIETTGGGLLFDPGATGELAERLARLMEDAPLRRRLGEQGAARVREHFTAERMAEQTWQVFHRYCRY